MKKIFTILFFLISSGVNANYWNQKTNFPFIGYGGVGFSIGNKGYIGTGWYGGVYSQQLWEWDQATDSWTQKANCPGVGRVFAAGFSIGTKGYLGTGDLNTGLGSPLHDFYEWDQLTNTWSQKADIGLIGMSQVVGFSIGSKGYFGTGYNNLNNFWEYDPVSDSWTQKAVFPGVGRRGATGFSIGTKGYIGTGEGSTGDLNDFWEWNQSTDTWIQKANFPGNVRLEGISLSILTKGYLGMGHPGHYDDFWEWDQSTNSWSQLPDLPADGRAYAVAFAVGQYGYVATGEYNGVYNDFWEFCPFNNCITGINENTFSRLKIYPTLVTSKLIISNNKSGSIIVLNVEGEILINKNFSKNNIEKVELDVSFLSAGIYFIKAGNEVKKFVKE